MEFYICIVIPAYNEEVAIARTILDYKRFFPKSRILVVDNNSSDSTSEVASGALDLSRDLLLFEPRRGKGAAVKTGLNRVSADIFIMTDGDGTYPVADARRLLDDLLETRCDMVVGDRVAGGTYKAQNGRRSHTLGNAFLTGYISFLSGQKFNDVLSGLRIMSRPFVNMLDIGSSGFQLETELYLIVAYTRGQVVESSISYVARPEGSESKLSTVRDGIRIAWFALLNCPAFYPIQAFGVLGVIFLLLSSILGTFVNSVYLNSGLMPYPSTAVAAATLALLGIQAIFVGLILKVIGRSAQRRDIAQLMKMRREWSAQLDKHPVRKAEMRLLEEASSE